MLQRPGLEEGMPENARKLGLGALDLTLITLIPSITGVTLRDHFITSGLNSLPLLQKVPQSRLGARRGPPTV